ALASGTGRLTIDRDAGTAVEGLRLRTAQSEISFDGRLGPSTARDVAAHLRVPHLAATEARALLGRRAPESDWSGELHAVGPDSAVVVTGDVRATIADAGGAHEVGGVRVDGTLDTRTPTPTGALRAAIAHVDLGAIAGPRLPASDLTGDVRLSTMPDAPRVVRFVLDLRAPRIGQTTLTTLAAN